MSRPEFPEILKHADYGLSRKQQTEIVDSFYCKLHNDWAELTGNNADKDLDWITEWIARAIRDDMPWLRRRMEGDDESSDSFDADVQRLAKLCMQAMPLLAGRMAA